MPTISNVGAYKMNKLTRQLLPKACNNVMTASGEGDWTRFKRLCIDVIPCAPKTLSRRGAGERYSRRPSEVIGGRLVTPGA